MSNLQKNFLAALADIVLLAAFVTALAAISWLFGIPTFSYFKLNIYMAIFLMPGWVLSHHFENGHKGIIFRFFMSGLIAFIHYGIIAFICFVLKLNFSQFYALFLISVIVTFIASLKQYSSYKLKNQFNGLNPIKFLTGLTTTSLLIYIMRYPKSADLTKFIGEQLDYLSRRNFEFSKLGMLAFDLDVVQPRMKSHFHHTFIALLSDVTNLDIVSILYILAVPILGLLMFASVYYFIKSIVTSGNNYAFIIFAILAPIFFFDPLAMNPYNYGFRFFNNPTLDKDFAHFFLLPGLLYITVMYLKTSSKKYLVLLLTAIPLTLFTHPLVALYNFITFGALFLGFLGKVRFRDLTIIGAYALLLFVIQVIANPQDSFHKMCDRLVLESLNIAPDLFYFEHYSIIPGTITDTISWFKGYMILAPSLFFNAQFNISVFFSYGYMDTFHSNTQIQARE